MRSLVVALNAAGYPDQTSCVFRAELANQISCDLQCLNGKCKGNRQTLTSWLWPLTSWPWNGTLIYTNDGKLSH